ncbi:DNA-methyltransferase [Zavarzinella formosa]|uniref:DNA-methyltransferase n=1 Tax=Zavarzinella formosa TaxID=360055 RepID=UPI0012F9E822|nr:site-specific DNA-methyltransferase [Zavarzinella formosa]
MTPSNSVTVKTGLFPPFMTGRHPISDAPWRIFCGDAVLALKEMGRNRYAAVITSPPYFWLRDYGVVGQLGREPKIDLYVRNIADVMDEVKRVLRPSGLLFLNLGDTYYSGKGRPQGRDRKHPGRRHHELRAVDASGLGVPKKTLLGMPWRVALAMIDRGWILRSAVIWRRTYATPEPSAKDRPWRTHEQVFIFAKSRVYNFDRRPLRKAGEEDVWCIPSHSRSGRHHPAVFPPELVERCLDVSGVKKKQVVLDPFAGSGTVLRVATARGLAADGIDLSEPFCRQMVNELMDSE